MESFEVNESRRNPKTIRKIVHVDMDAFYASVEVLDNPSLRGLPLVVGGRPGSRSVVCTASYEARKFGVRSAMSSTYAAKLCPDAVFIPPRFDRYREVSQAIRSIFSRFTNIIEPLSLDEAYLDVTDHPSMYATKIASEIRKAIFSELGLTCSAGVGPNKLIAKIASDVNKPNGLTVVQPHQVLDFLKRMPLKKIHGVGPATEKKLILAGFTKCEDLWNVSLEDVEAMLGSWGRWIWQAARGLDQREVVTHWKRKSYGREDTLNEDELNVGKLKNKIEILAGKVASSLDKAQTSCRTITLKIKYSNFESITRASSLSLETRDHQVIAKICCDLLLSKTEAGRRPIRLVGVSVSKLVDD
jgi:DNA polymerase IV